MKSSFTTSNNAMFFSVKYSNLYLIFLSSFITLFFIFCGNLFGHKTKELILDSPFQVHKPPIQGIVFIIHGTFAHKTSWYQPGGDFYEALKFSANKKNYKIIPFHWSGNLSDLGRIKAAHDFVKLLLEYPPELKKIIIAHSHAGNIVFIASQLLAQQSSKKTTRSFQRFIARTFKTQTKKSSLAKKTVKELLILSRMVKTLKTEPTIEITYLLGTPMSKKYEPNYTILKRIINLYSKNDCVQTICGICKRKLPLHAQTINLEIFFANNKLSVLQSPGHSQLHAPAIAYHILNIFEELQKQKIPSWEQSNYGKEGKVVFFADGTFPYFAAQ